MGKEGGGRGRGKEGGRGVALSSHLYPIFIYTLVELFSNVKKLYLPVLKYRDTM
jgi:hypothetical protein